MCLTSFTVYSVHLRCIFSSQRGSCPKAIEVPCLYQRLALPVFGVECESYLLAHYNYVRPSITQLRDAQTKILPGIRIGELLIASEKLHPSRGSCQYVQVSITQC